MRFLSVILTVQVVLDTIGCLANLQTFVYASRGERTIQNSFIVEQHLVRSKVECITKCTLSSGCTGLSWKPPENNCLLTDGDTAAEGVNNNRFLPEASWEAMIKIIYPVVHYEGPSGRYTLTFAQARDLCAQINTAVASLADLLHARSLGYAKCNCGWLSDGTNGLVMQTYVHKCGGPLNMCNRPLANVYCRVPEYIYPSR